MVKLRNKELKKKKSRFLKIINIKIEKFKQFNLKIITSILWNFIVNKIGKKMFKNQERETN